MTENEAIRLVLALAQTRLDTAMPGQWPEREEANFAEAVRFLRGKLLDHGDSLCLSWGGLSHD